MSCRQPVLLGTTQGHGQTPRHRPATALALSPCDAAGHTRRVQGARHESDHSQAHRQSHRDTGHCGRDAQGRGHRQHPPLALLRSSLRHRQRRGAPPLCAQRVFADEATDVLGGSPRTGTRPRALCERLAIAHLRTEKPVDAPDGARGRHQAIQGGAIAERTALPLRTLPCPLRRGQGRGVFLHAPRREEELLHALQPWSARRQGRGQPGEP